MHQVLIGEAGGNRRLFWLVGLGLAGGLTAVLQAYCFAAVVDGVFLGGLRLGQVQWWLAALAALALLRAGLVWGTELAGFKLAAAIKARLRLRVYDRVLAAGPVRAGGEDTGEVASVLAEGIESLEPYFAKFLPHLATAALVPLLILAVVFRLDAVSAVLMLVTAPLIPVFMVLIGRWAENLSRSRWDMLGRLGAHLLDVLTGMADLKLFGRSKDQIAVVRRSSEAFRAATLEVLRVAFLSALALELLSTVSTALVAVTVGLKLLYSGIGFREALFILLLAPEYYLPLRLLGSHFHSGLAAKTAAEKIFRLLALPAEDKAAAGATVAAGDGIRVEFAAVSFAYGGGRVGLDGASFTLERGERTALVGPSGAGKTTVANLLLGFVEADAGKILVNGVAIGDLERSGWLRQVAYVPQFPHLFAASVADNIRFGLEGDDEAVIEAARAAGADEFIRRLPQGYATAVGEGGRALSGGEAQRLAIARAFFKKAPFVILDEATSALDPRSERRVREALERLAQGRTVLIIAHRLATVRQADKIVVLDRGRVVEQGGHAQLSGSGGLYAALTAAGREAV